MELSGVTVFWLARVRSRSAGAGLRTLPGAGALADELLLRSFLKIIPCVKYLDFYAVVCKPSSVKTTSLYCL